MSEPKPKEPTPYVDPHAPAEYQPKPPDEGGKGPPDHANKPDQPPGQADKPEGVPKSSKR